jgi:1-aminocyclopropane-1-carboxylate deaminase/D-cysteine desulfhydrase-like pyridoxal-dependent ACC family enzyme
MANQPDTYPAGTPGAGAADRQLFDDIRARIARVPRVRLAITPTPMMEASNLARHLGGPRIFIKRDDLTGIAFGGNKLRNLEFRLARTLEENADTVIVGLDLQSNSARQTVGACNKLGLRTILVLEGARPAEVQGNLLVNYLLGAEIHFARDAAEQRSMMDAAAQRVREQGGRPYILNDNPMFETASALAYLETTLEMLDQLSAEGLAPACFYMSSGGKGQAGMALARELLGGRFGMRGVTASHKHDVPHRTAAIARQAAELLGLDASVAAADIENYDNFVDKGYGIPSAAGNAAVRLFARHEGIMLDPIYTGKCAAAMLAHIREGQFGKDDVLVFVHTGGMPALFTWHDEWLDQAAQEKQPAGR